MQRLAFAFLCYSLIFGFQYGHAAERGAPAPVLNTPEALDIWTYAKPHVARVTHVDLDLVADFENKRVYGTAMLDIDSTADAQSIILDTDGLLVESIEDPNGNRLQWSLGTQDPALGAPLEITTNGAKRLVIRYSSAPGAAALQWLPKEATTGGRQPFLFSQGQSIVNRTWIPTQDSPGIRQTWSARITVPEAVIPVMSGISLTPEGVATGDGRKSYRFEMTNPVPPYLIALAIGDLDFRELGPRSGVYAEPEIVERAAHEFADVEKMIDVAEALYGPYRWGRYDMLVLPPSFPYGGMENPNMTFLTPSIITGDRSNTDVVAHELAHSWSGNLVTNATWKDGWLNEGFTTYFENRIMEAVYGKERAAMYADLDFEEMQRIIDKEGKTSPTTKLHADPNDGPVRIQYFKGATFLRTMEQAVGRARWDAYLKSYFDRHAFQPQTTAGFLKDLRARLIKGDTALEEQLLIDRWAYEAGLPENAVAPQSETLATVDKTLAAYIAGGATKNVGVTGWSTQQWLRFLRGLPRKQTQQRLSELDSELGLTNSSNAYVQSAWFEIAVANRYEPVIPALQKYLADVGRILLIRPIYTKLVEQGDWGRQIAASAYDAAKTGYHPLTKKVVTAILKGS